MGRSQETFSKKEKEKKRLRKRKEKEEKKEEKKANQQEQSFEDMIAYVDEDGNITSTPPDPKKKKTVYKSEDIVIGVPKQGDLEPMETIRKGTVTFFNDAKGYGFIKDHETQESIFVHANGLTEEIKENNQVTFEVEMGPKGPNAFDVKVIR